MKKSEYTPSRELFSKCVKAGSRFYYIDAKQDSSGNYYMVMSESRVSGAMGARERQRIFVYEEDIEKFVSALSEVTSALTKLSQMRDEQPSTKEQTETHRIAKLELPDVEEFLRQGE